MHFYLTIFLCQYLITLIYQCLSCIIISSSNGTESLNFLFYVSSLTNIAWSDIKCICIYVQDSCLLNFTLPFSFVLA